jgi:hypothetical protein
VTEHCGVCGSRLCGHGACPDSTCAMYYACEHCNGGDPDDKYFGDDECDPKERWCDARAEGLVF